MSKLGDILNRVHASSSAEEALRLLDEGLAEALAWNETDWIYMFAKMAGDVSEKRGELRRAVQYLDLIPLHVGNDAWVYLSLGRLWFALGEREQGLAHFRACHRTASTKRGQKQVLKDLEQELGRHQLRLADLGA